MPRRVVLSNANPKLNGNPTSSEQDLQSQIHPQLEKLKLSSKSSNQYRFSQRWYRENGDGWYRESTSEEPLFSTQNQQWYGYLTLCLNNKNKKDKDNIQCVRELYLSDKPDPPLPKMITMNIPEKLRGPKLSYSNGIMNKFRLCRNGIAGYG